MKNKIIAFALIATTALSLVACGGSSDTKVIESTNTTSTTEASTNSGYVFSYNGTTIPVDADAAPIIEALGEPNSYFESPSCAAEGIDLSSSRDDIIAAYGNPTEEATGSMKYATDTMTLVFVFDDDSLVSIEYDSLKN